MQKTPGWKRNLLYPLAFIFVFGLTAIAVLMVVLNTLQLLVGIKALPISARVEYQVNQVTYYLHSSWVIMEYYVKFLYFKYYSVTDYIPRTCLNLCTGILGSSSSGCSHIFFDFNLLNWALHDSWISELSASVG